MRDQMRTMSAMCALLCAISMPAAAEQWAFDASLDGKAIGQHTFTLEKNGDAKTLTSVASFNVKVLFINAYKYQHRATETWQGDCLSSLEANTKENSDVTDVKGKLDQGTFRVQAPKGALELPACVMTFAYWNPLMLKQQKLLNPQTGEWLNVSISKLGRQTIDVRGTAVEADHYKLEAPKLKIELWYSPQQEWLALQSTTPEGYVLRYKLR